MELLTKLRDVFMNVVDDATSFSHDVYWWFLYRFHPRHRYHVAMTGLKPGYHDTDERIYSTIFTELERFMETTNVDWDTEESHIAAAKVFREAIEFWRKSKRQSFSGDVPLGINGYFDVIDKFEKERQEHLHKIVDNIDMLWD